jgi:hypothetical protein
VYLDALVSSGKVLGQKAQQLKQGAVAGAVQGPTQPQDYQAMAQDMQPMGATPEAREQGRMAQADKAYDLLAGDIPARTKQEAAMRFPSNITTEQAESVPMYKNLPDKLPDPGARQMEAMTAQADLEWKQARAANAKGKSMREAGAEQDENLVRVYTSLKDDLTAQRKAEATARQQVEDLKDAQKAASEAMKGLEKAEAEDNRVLMVLYQRRVEQYGDPKSYDERIKKAKEEEKAARNVVRLTEKEISSIGTRVPGKAGEAIREAGESYKQQRKQTNFKSALVKAMAEMQSGQLGVLGGEVMDERKKAEIVNQVGGDDLDDDTRAALMRVLDMDLLVTAEFGADPSTLLSESGLINLSNQNVIKALVNGATIEDVARVIRQKMAEEKK